MGVRLFTAREQDSTPSLHRNPTLPLLVPYVAVLTTARRESIVIASITPSVPADFAGHPGSFVGVTA